MNKHTRIAALREEIAQLDALRGTSAEPVALAARIGQLRRTLAWHESRVDPPHYNTGRFSLYERSGRSKRTLKRFPVALDYPAVSL